MTPLKHEDWMRLALEQARIAFEKDEVPIGAIIVNKGELLAAAHNEKEERQDPTAHAEILAIQRGVARLGHWRLSGSLLYVTLEPCPMCAGAIVQSRLSQIVFGATDLKGGAAGSVMNVLNQNYWNHKVEVTAGILEEECSQILKDYFKQKR